MTAFLTHFAAAHSPELHDAGNEAALAGSFVLWFVFSFAAVLSLHHFVKQTPDTEEE